MKQKKESPPTSARYVSVGPKVLKAGELICGARSNTTAKLIANALNAYTPDRRGI